MRSRWSIWGLRAVCAGLAVGGWASAAEPALDLPSAPLAPPAGDRPFLAAPGLNDADAAAPSTQAVPSRPVPTRSVPLRTADRGRRNQPSDAGQSTPPLALDPPPAPVGGGFSSPPAPIASSGAAANGVDSSNGTAAKSAPGGPSEGAEGAYAGGCEANRKDERRAWWFRQYAGSVEMQSKEYYPPLYSGNYYFRPWKPDWVQPQRPPIQREPHLDPYQPRETYGVPQEYELQSRRGAAPPARAAKAAPTIR